MRSPSASVCAASSVRVTIGSLTATRGLKSTEGRTMRTPKLTYSNVAATLALFLALGGGAYAITLGKGSVKRKNIANGAVSTKKLAKNAVTGAKAKESSFGAVPNASKLGGVGPGGYVTGINAIQRVAAGQVGIGGNSSTFVVSGI